VGSRGGADGSPGRWKRIQRVAFWLMVAGVVLAASAAVGITSLPSNPPALVWSLHAVLLALGVGCGFAAVGRSREIDRERWRLLGDTSLTSGEREYAHREAEAELRSAGRVFVLSGVALGAFAAYLLRTPGEIGAADLLIVTPLLGFAAGLLVGSRVFPAVTPGG
jgi:uncharacterized membrane protein YbhN (UPF0104 family)